MSNCLCKNFGLIDGHTYIIAREDGVYWEDHIYINSPSVSRRHAAMKIKNGRIYLCDLDSTNGTYLIENDSLVPFKEGYVSPSQLISIGHVKCTISSLLAITGVYNASKNITSNSEDTEIMSPNQQGTKKKQLNFFSNSLTTT